MRRSRHVCPQSGQKTTLEPPGKPWLAQQWLLKHPHECHPRDMNREKSIGILASVLACCVSVTAQDRGLWRAANSSAQSITGDVAISGDKLSINYTSFTIAQIRAPRASRGWRSFRYGQQFREQRLSLPVKRTGNKKIHAQEHSVWIRGYAVDGHLRRRELFAYCIFLRTENTFSYARADRQPRLVASAVHL